MFKVQLKDKWFDVPNGVSYNDYNLVIPVLAEDTSISEIKELLTPVQDEIVIYEEDLQTIIALFENYTTLSSLDLQYNVQRIDIDEVADMITIILNKEKLKEQVDQNTEDIERDEAQLVYTALMTDTLIDIEEEE